jgi:hypothetical protein
MAEQRTFVERRRGPDIVIKAVWWIIGISWLMILSAYAITSKAQPQLETIIERSRNDSVRKYLDRNLLEYALYVLVINLIVCIIGFVLNMLRQRRKTDKISKSILVLGAITITCIVWYLTKYGI